MEELIARVLKENEIEFEVHESNDRYQGFSFDESSEHGIIHGLINIHTDQKILVIRRIISNPIPEKRASEVMELISRLNNSYILAYFNLDLDELIVCNEFSFFYTDNMEENESRFIDSYDILSGVLNRFYPGFLAVAYGNRKPIEVLQEIENSVD